MVCGRDMSELGHLDAKGLFDKLDSDHDGKLDLSELKQFLTVGTA